MAPAPASDPAVDQAQQQLELERNLLALEAQEQELKRQIEQERLATDRTALEDEKAKLAKEQAEFAKQKQQALETPSAEKSAAPPSPSAPGNLATPGSIPVEPPTAPRATVVQAAYTPGEDYGVFYEDLAPEGEWFDSPDYGYVWQPAVARSDSAWRPYTRGRWANCDMGWTWVSEEPFGWAVYHYGRWALLEGFGWVWIPGDVWAPAWVAWRHTDQYVGWCPLPPETVYVEEGTFTASVDDDYGISASTYTFMPVDHFDEPVISHCMAASMSATIIRMSINVTSLIFRPGHVHCGGPKPDWINRFLHRPMPLYTVERRFQSEGHEHHHPRLEESHLHLYGPRVKAPWNLKLKPLAEVKPLDKFKVIRRPEPMRMDVWKHFESERNKRLETAADVVKTDLGRKVMERQKVLAEIQKHRDLVKKPGDDLQPKIGVHLSGAGPQPGPGESRDAKSRLDKVREDLAKRQEELQKLRNQAGKDGTPGLSIPKLPTPPELGGPAKSPDASKDKPAGPPALPLPNPPGNLGRGRNGGEDHRLGSSTNQGTADAEMVRRKMAEHDEQLRKLNEEQERLRSTRDDAAKEKAQQDREMAEKEKLAQRDARAAAARLAAEKEKAAEVMRKMQEDNARREKARQELADHERKAKEEAEKKDEAQRKLRDRMRQAQDEDEKRAGAQRLATEMKRRGELEAAQKAQEEKDKAERMRKLRDDAAKREAEEKASKDQARKLEQENNRRESLRREADDHRRREDLKRAAAQQEALQKMRDTQESMRRAAEERERRDLTNQKAAAQREAMERQKAAQAEAERNAQAKKLQEAREAAERRRKSDEDDANRKKKR